MKDSQMPRTRKAQNGLKRSAEFATQWLIDSGLSLPKREFSRNWSETFGNSRSRPRELGVRGRKRIRETRNFRAICASIGAKTKRRIGWPGQAGIELAGRRIFELVEGEGFKTTSPKTTDGTTEIGDDTARAGTKGLEKNPFSTPV